jgi:Cu/Ag efflux pump CusA
MHSLVGSSLRFRSLILAAAAGLIVLGALQLPNASVDALPEFSPPYVEVQTEALGLSAEEVEQLITVPLEADLLNGVAWLDSIESRSVPGLSSIVLTFEPGTDPIRARQMVAERLTQAHALPNVSKPPAMLQPLSSSNRVMMVSLTSDDLSLIDVSVLARWTIRPRLMGVPGVANVAIWGQRERQLQVLVDPQRLADNGVSLEHVIKATGNALWVSPLTYLEASTPGTGGFIDTPNQRLNVQHVLPIDTAEDLAQVVIEPDVPNADVPRLGEVAEVVEDHQPLIGDALVNGGPGLLLVIEKFPEANTLEVTGALEDALAAMRAGLGDIEIDTTVFRPATFLESAVLSIGLVALVGLALASVLLVGLLGWRAAAVSLASIVVSLLASAIVLHALGATFNLMVVAGFVVAIGVIVDEAITSTSRTLERLRASGDGDGEASRLAVITQATVDVRVPVVYASLIILLAAVPLLLIGGVPGALLPPLLIAFAVALAVAAIVSVTVTPALAMTLLRTDVTEHRVSRLVTRLQERYGLLMRRLVHRTQPALAVVAVSAVAAVVLFAASLVPKVDAAGIPALRDRDVLIHWDGAAGTSRSEMARLIGLASDELGQLPGVRSVGAHVGRAITSDMVVGINAGEIWVSIDAAADYEATLESVQRVIDGYPGMRRSLLTYADERINQIVGDPGDDVVVRVFGQDLDVLRDKADDVRDAMSNLAGVTSVSVESQVEEPTVAIEVDLAAAGRHGLKPGDVRRSAATLLSGIEVGSLFEGQKVFEVVVWGTPESRQSLSSIRELGIPTPENGVIRLDEVADVRIMPAPAAILRDAVQRRIDVAIAVSGRDVGAVLADVEHALAGVDFPLETHAEVLGLTAERQATLGALLTLVAAAAIGAVLLLQAAFASWRLAFIALLMVPAGLVGGMLVAVVIGTPGSIATLGGLLGVLAIAVRQLVMLGERFVRLRTGDDPPAAADAVVEAARDSLMPMLATCVVTGAILIAAAGLGSMPGLELVQLVSLVMLGGLATTTLLNLFIGPAVFLRSGASAEMEPTPVGAEQAPEPHAVGAR